MNSRVRCDPGDAWNVFRLTDSPTSVVLLPVN